jgi:hypothetical protein
MHGGILGCSGPVYPGRRDRANERITGNYLKLNGVKKAMYGMYGDFVIWSIWPELSLLYRLYWLLLSLVSLYTLFSAASIVRHFRISNRQDSPENARRITNLRQLIAGMFFAFGALFFWTLPDAFSTISDGIGYPIHEYIGRFRLHFAFAANVFFVFLLLHCVQWFLSRRVLGEVSTVTKP